MTDRDLWLGIDLGTQGVKVVVVASDGTSLATAQTPLASRREGSLHEQDPRDWIAAVATVIVEALAALNAAERKSIRGLAICSTSGTFAAVDAAGAAVGPGIMYDDGRGASSLGDVRAADPAHWAGAGADSLPPQPQPSWALAKFAWLAQIGLAAGAVKVAHQGDVVASAMVGGPVPTDWSSALKSGYDLRARRWPERVFAAIGFDLRLLPDVVAPGTRIGATDNAWQDRTGLPAGTPVFAGATDGCAGQFGAGALGLGSWHSVVGTTLVLKGVTADPLSDDAAGIYSHLSPGGDSWLPGGASSVGAGALSEFLPTGTDLDSLTEVARESWPTGPLPVAYPLVSPGERFPISAPNFAGFLLPGSPDAASPDAASPDAVALPLSSLAKLAPADALTAIFVGVAAVERLCLERLGVLGAGATAPHRLSTSGGGARNTDWVRLRASMLGTPITRLTGAEGSLGMAALAAWGAQRVLHGGERQGKASLAEIAERMSATLDVIEPDPALEASLLATYARFRRQVDVAVGQTQPGATSHPTASQQEAAQ